MKLLLAYMLGVSKGDVVGSIFKLIIQNLKYVLPQCSLLLDDGDSSYYLLEINIMRKNFYEFLVVFV